MRRDRSADVLLFVAALGAAVGGVSSLAALGDVDAGARVAELWRAWGLLFFAGLFVVLARVPELPDALWALVIANKVVLTLSLSWLATSTGTEEAAVGAVADGALTVLLVVAYLLHRGRATI